MLRRRPNQHYISTFLHTKFERQESSGKTQSATKLTDKETKPRCVMQQTRVRGFLTEVGVPTFLDDQGSRTTPLVNEVSPTYICPVGLGGVALYRFWRSQKTAKKGGQKKCVFSVSFWCWFVENPLFSENTFWVHSRRLGAGMELVDAMSVRWTATLKTQQRKNFFFFGRGNP